MSGAGGPTIPHALKSNIVQLMLCFSAVRLRWVAQIVEYGVAEARLRDLHIQTRTLGRVYAHDDNTLDAFLDSAWKQLLTQSAQYTHMPTREAYLLHQGIPLHGACVHLWPQIGAGVSKRC